MKTDTEKGMRVFSCVVKSLAFVALYLTLMTACGMTAARWLAILPALGFIVPMLVFARGKWAKRVAFGLAVLYTVLCIAAGFSEFGTGANIFGDLAAKTVNDFRHAGWEYSGVEYGMSADFVFSSVIAVWVAIATIVVCKKSGIAFIAISVLTAIVLMMMGLLPAYYCIIPLFATWIGLLVGDRGFSLKAAWPYVAVMAAVCVTVGVCAVYNGSAGVKNFRASVADAAERFLYGSDTLPQGDLVAATGLHADDEKRLTVTLSSRTKKLYLKGFTGSDLKGNVWKETDKNIYVSQDYRGLMDYISEEGLPFMQFSRYSALSGNGDNISITVKNENANAKYMYVPYGLRERETGSAYYDLNMRNGAWASKTYEYSVFAGDGSSEWTTQERWLLDETLRTPAMNNYLAVENEYRAFVHATYGNIDDKTKALIREELYGIPTDSINTAARLLRTYFEENFTLSEKPDRVSGNFIADFFGQKIKKANSVYYATAATYVFRAFGFSARYVEGYLVEAEEGKSGVHTVAVTSKNAHAWTEVYFDGIGWLPIEVTFEVPDPTVPIDPDDPGTEKPPEEDPDPPPVEEPVGPPDDPDIGGKDKEVLTKAEESLKTALKVLLPILSVALGAALVVLFVVWRRKIIIDKKNKRLEAKDSEFGRAAFGIVERDCKSIGGWNKEKLKEYGIDEASSERFMQLIEKSVYGEYELNANERNIVLRYINAVADAVTKNGGKTNRLTCKYIDCVGI